MPKQGHPKFQVPLPERSLNYLYALSEERGRIYLPEDLSQEGVVFLGAITSTRTRAQNRISKRLLRSLPRGIRMMDLSEDRVFLAYRVPIEEEEEKTDGDGRRWGPGEFLIHPLVTARESGEGDVHLLKIVNDLSEPSFILIRPAGGKEDVEDYMQKSEASLSDQDKADLDAIQDMYDNIDMDHMYMDQSEIGGSPNDGGGGEDDSSGGESIDPQDGGDNTGDNDGGGGGGDGD